MIRLFDNLATTYFKYNSVKVTEGLPEPEKNANERLDYDIRLPIPIDLGEKTMVILFNRANYNFLDSHDPYNQGGFQELIVNLLRTGDQYSFMLSGGMTKKNYDQHILSQVLSQVFFKNQRVFSSDLFLKSILFRVRNINGRHDYVTVWYMVADLGNSWQLNLTFPSELSLAKDHSTSLFKFGIRVDGLENLVEAEDKKDYWMIGYRAYGFVRYAHAILDPVWASIEIGSAFENFEAYDSRAKEAGKRTSIASLYSLLSVGVRFN